MRGSRVGHSATLLDDGTVLVVGGYGNLGDRNGFRSDAEIFDPDTRRWSDAVSLTTPRPGHTATRLDDGRVLVFGGGDPNQDAVFGAAEVYDPDLGIWLPGAFTHSARWGHTATLLADGTVLVAGGEEWGDGADSVEARLFNPR